MVTTVLPFCFLKGGLNEIRHLTRIIQKEMKKENTLTRLVVEQEHAADTMQIGRHVQLAQREEVDPNQVAEAARNHSHTIADRQPCRWFYLNDR